MTRRTAPTIFDVAADKVERTGFFCFMSKKKSEGYQRKLTWLKDRFAEGMRITMLELHERGFIEYIPGEHAWRAVHADGYLLIHCLWVVGKSKGKGFADALLDACMADAKRMKMKGVAMVTSEKVLMVKKLGKHPSPSFAGDWERKARALGKGLTVIRSDQCPYIVDATNTGVAAAAKAGVKSQVVEPRSRDDVMRLLPSAYGVFSLVFDGRILSCYYQLEKDLLPLLAGTGKEEPARKA